MAASTKPVCTEREAPRRDATLRRVASRRRQRGAVMLEGTLVAVLMASVFAAIIFMGQCLNAKLDAAYRSRFQAFSGAMHDCSGGEAAPRMDPQGQPDANDPEAQRITASMESEMQLSAAVMNVATGSVTVTSNDQSFSSQSWAGCVEPSYGGSSLPGDSSAIQNQLEAMFPYLWGLVSPLFDFGL